MKARLTDDLTAPVTLAELAASVGLSTFHAARLFTRETGLAPHAWRNQMRLARSLGALRAGVSVTEVAAASGFTDQSHFTRHFKRRFRRAARALAIGGRQAARSRKRERRRDPPQERTSAPHPARPILAITGGDIERTTRTTAQLLANSPPAHATPSR